MLSLAFPAGKPARPFSDGAARLAGVAGALLGWRPDEFWRATPEELATIFSAMAGDGDGAGPPDTGDLARLMARFPD